MISRNIGATHLWSHRGWCPRWWWVEDVLVAFHSLFGTWWQRGSEGVIYVLVWACIDLYRTYVSISFRTPLIFVRTMWCENICNVCYFMLSCRICLYSKEFVLVWEFFLWLGDCFFVCSGSEGLDTPGYRPDSPDSLTGVSGLQLGVSGSRWQTHFLLSG